MGPDHGRADSARGEPPDGQHDALPAGGLGRGRHLPVVVCDERPHPGRQRRSDEHLRGELGAGRGLLHAHRPGDVQEPSAERSLRGQQPEDRELEQLGERAGWHHRAGQPVPRLHPQPRRPGDRWRLSERDDAEYHGGRGAVELPHRRDRGEHEDRQDQLLAGVPELRRLVSRTAAGVHAHCVRRAEQHRAGEGHGRSRGHGHQGDG